MGTTETLPQSVEARLERIERQLAWLISVLERFMPLIEKYERSKGAVRQAFGGRKGT